MPTHTHSCRLCGNELCEPVIDLGRTPLANEYLQPDQVEPPQATYPLRLFLCPRCGLLQSAVAATPDAIFADYAYFSSVSRTLLAQSEMFSREISERLSLSPDDIVVEIASNDGYLLKFFRAHGLRVLGVEPAKNIAAVALAQGIPTLCRFFGTQTAQDIVRVHGRSRLVVANNVLAHVPEVNDFLAGLAILLAPGGTLSIEFHHLLRLVEDAQFDNIYHEHFQYFSLATAMLALAAHGLVVVDVEELPAQGGSLRLSVVHADDQHAEVSARVGEMSEREARAGLATTAAYHELAARAAKAKAALLSFLVSARQTGKSVVCFGAAAKGNTLLNYCGVHRGLVDYAVDSSPHKQGLLLPGSQIPVHDPQKILETRPDYVLILPWNLASEIVAQMSPVRTWGGQFVVAVPELRVLG